MIRHHPDRMALFDRDGAGGYVFALQNADDVTLENLSITGAYEGIYASASSDSDRLTLRRLNVFNNANWGIELDALQRPGHDRGQHDLRQSPGHLCGRHRRLDQRQHGQSVQSTWASGSTVALGPRSAAIN